jgi:DNA/RNA endonuclease YhcR with UshA esterase domain
MQMRRVVYLVIGAALIAGAVAQAHHSYAATYDVSNEVKLEGKLVQFVYRNPHSFVHLQAPDQNGTQQRWAVEWAGTGQLADAGVQRDTLKVGDAVVIVGRPSRVRGEYRALMVRLTRPSDGFSWGGRAGQVVD